jgi:predicted nuclease of predicted toxin-antitoxin system
VTIILDAQLSPSLAFWLKQNYHVKAIAVRDLGLRDASDKEIFYKARELSAVIITKDIDFLTLQDRFGSPPQVILISCGNTSNEKMIAIFSKTLENAFFLLESGEQFIEIRG